MNKLATTGAVAPKERALRSAIVAASIFALPIAPSVVFGVHIAVVLFAWLAGVPAAFVLGFYALWLVGILTEGVEAQLIGDSDLRIPPLYWPWGSYQRTIRHRRRVRALEIACQIPTRDYWYDDA